MAFNYGNLPGPMDMNMDWASMLGGSSSGSPDFSSLAANPGGMGMPGMGGMGGPVGGLGFNLPTLNGIVGGIGALGSLWGGFQQQKMAKKAFKFQKNMSLINLANQVKSYNTALADRSRSRGVMESQSQAEQDRYVRDNSLSTKR